MFRQGRQGPNPRQHQQGEATWRQKTRRKKNVQDEDGDMISISYIRLYYYTLSKPVCIYYTGYAYMDIYIYTLYYNYIYNNM